jgi:hypothetical protein
VDFSTLINSAINGIFVGFGSGLGAWIVSRHMIRHLEKLESKIKNGKD